MYQSIPSTNTPTPGIPPGNFTEVVKNPSPGEKFSAKARPWGKIVPTLRNILEDLACLNCLQQGNFRVLQKSNLIILGCLSNYSLATMKVPYFIILKYSSCFEKDFFTGELLQLIDQFEAKKCLNATSTDNLVLMILDHVKS